MFFVIFFKSSTERILKCMSIFNKNLRETETSYNRVIIFAYFSKSCVLVLSQMRLLSQTIPNYEQTCTFGLNYGNFMYIHLVKIQNSLT